MGPHPVFSMGPHALAINSQDEIFIGDNNNYIQKFDRNGQLLTYWGGYTADGLFRLPIDIAINMEGNIYVADFNNHRIQYFSPDGLFLESGGHKAMMMGNSWVHVGLH